MIQWAPVEAGQPKDLVDFVRWQESLASDAEWVGFWLHQAKAPPGEIPEGSWQRHLVYLHLGEPAKRERNVAGEGWRTEHLKPGSVFIIPADVPLAVRWHDPLSCLEVHIEPELISGLFADDRLELFPAYAEADPFIAQLFDALRREVRDGLPRGRLYGDCLGTALAAHLVRYYSSFQGCIRSPRGSLPRNRLRRVVEYINDRLDQDLSLTELADVVGLNPDYFARAFKQTTRLPPYRYVLLKRIERACALLRDPSISIAEITARSGFASQSSFTTAFRRIKGITPSAYRHARL